MKRARFFLAAALILVATWFTATSAYGFDIAIYGDPLSQANFGVLDCYRHWNTHATCDEYWLESWYDPAQTEAAYAWYQQMGVTHVMVNYIDDENNFDWIVADCTHIQLLNWNFPGPVGFRGDKYVDAQYRDVQVGLTQEEQGVYWSYVSSVPNPEWRTTATKRNESNELEERPVVATTGTAGTMWRPQSYLGNFSGWDWVQSGWQDSTLDMPMHFKLTWAVDPSGTIDTLSALANFYWIVQAPNDVETGAARWWQFPAKPLILPTRADTNNWITSEFVDSSQSGVYHLLNENFVVLDSIPTDGMRSGPASPPRSLDDIYLSGVSFGIYTAVRTKVDFLGQHTFYLNRIEVYDEGAWRMFASPDSSDWEDSILVAFQSEYSAGGGKLGGWYYDEWDISGDGNGNPVLRSINNIQKILSDHGLPPFYLNGHTFWPGGPQNKQLRDLEAAGVHLPVKMHEFYPIASATWPMPHSPWASSASWIWTDTTSDRAYVDAEPGQTVWDGNCNRQQLIGTKSLQCAMDGAIWDWHPIDSLTGTLPSGCGDYIPGLGGMLYETKWVHDSTHSKMWALIAGGSDLPFDSSSGNCCPLRDPTPNEAKLTAWLAVACDVDGVMWYPWNYGGLFQWNDPPTEFSPTARYDGAQEFGQDIRRIAPFLEGTLDFVRTYASRAFETEYPDSTFDGTTLDVLCTDCPWYSGQNYRAVGRILTWEPDGQGGWEPEDNSYVQVSRFRNRLIQENDSTVEDYWFLIVNRRALANEQRKIRLEMQINPAHENHPYYIDYMLADSTISALPCAGDIPACAFRNIDVVLEPGEAELVHFYRGELGCDVTEIEIANLTTYREGADQVRLRWESIGADTYFICGSPRAQGPWTAFAFTQDTTYVDTVFSSLPRYFYTVQGCWNSDDDDGNP